MYKTEDELNLNILIIDGESTLTYNFCRCFDNCTVQIFVISKLPKSPLASSKNIKKHIYLKHSYEKKDLEQFKDIIIHNKIDLIYALSDVGIVFTGTFIQEFNKIAQVAILPELESFNRASDKFLFGQLCSSHSIPVPETFKLSDAHKINTDGKTIAKPIHASGGEGIKVFNSKNDLLAFRSGLSEEKEQGYIVQHYISGFDIDCNIIAKEGKLIAYSIQKGFSAGNNQFAPYEGIEFLYDERVIKLAEQLMACLNWNGVSHIDMRYDAETNQLYVIEINCRYWQSLIASKLVAEVNFPLIHLQLSMNKPVHFDGYKTGAYISSRKFPSEKIKQFRQISSQVIKFKHSNLYLQLTDPFYLWAYLKKKYLKF